MDLADSHKTAPEAGQVPFSIGHLLHGMIPVNQ
jgi:hypothetical protein